MTKAQMMKHWEKLEADQAIMPHFRALPYKSTGSRFGTCGIRIDGTPEFVDAVLSHLKECLQGEGVYTRLACSYNEVKPVMDKSWDNAESGAVCAYIRLAERGEQAAYLEAIIADHQARKTA